MLKLTISIIYHIMSITYCESDEILSNPDTSNVYDDDMQSFLSYTELIFFLFLMNMAEPSIYIFFISCLLTVVFSFNALKSILWRRTLKHDFKP